jgi:hypothetical protein
MAGVREVLEPRDNVAFQAKLVPVFWKVCVVALVAVPQFVPPFAVTSYAIPPPLTLSFTVSMAPVMVDDPLEAEEICTVDDEPKGRSCIVRPVPTTSHDLEVEP